MREIGVGLIGTGFMGKAHALAWRMVRPVMGDVPPVRLEILGERPAQKARQMADQFGFARATDDWQKVVADPRVDVVSIATPNHLHKEMALAALAAGKHVWCEKPMALTLGDSREMAAAARTAGRVTMLGYNYLRNPAFAHACALIAAGEIGEVVHFRGWVDEDYQADPDQPWTWRARRADAGLGALGDLGCHLISMMARLMDAGACGAIDSLIADSQIIHKTRALADGSGSAKVENEDTATAILRFASGAQGSVSTSRSAWGRKNRLAWEVHGTHGMITFDQERMNELRLFRQGHEAGFQTILTGPEHPPYDRFCPAAGHQLGFGDLKVIEAAELARAIAGGPPCQPDFATALGYEEIIHAIDQSARSGRRMKPEDAQ